MTASAELIARLLAHGLITPDQAQRELDDNTDTATDLAETLQQLAGLDGSLPELVRQRRLSLADAWYRDASQDWPTGLMDLPDCSRGWADPIAVGTDASRLLADWLCLQLFPADTSGGLLVLSSAVLAQGPDRELTAEERKDLVAAVAGHWPDELCRRLVEQETATTVDPLTRVLDRLDEDRSEVLDRLITWPRPEGPGRLVDLELEATEQERLLLMARARFGPRYTTWADWRHWFRTQADQATPWSPTDAGALLWIDAFMRGMPPDFLQACAEQIVKGRALPAPDEVAIRWSLDLPDREWRLLMGEQPAPSQTATPSQKDPAIPTADEFDTLDLDIDEPTIPERVIGAEEPSPARPSAEPPAQADTSATSGAAAPPSPPTASEAKSNSTKTRAVEPARTTVWLDHLKSFIDEHWVLLVGAIMVLAGTSLVAYYTWDRHWLVRYTLLPGILAGLTVALARAGNWLQRRDAKLTNTATILRALAIGLLPAHALVPSLLIGDETVTGKAISLPIALLLYTGGIGLALRRWCGAVHAHFRGGLAIALGVGIIAVVLAPMTKLLGWDPHTGSALMLGWTYVGFLAAIVVVHRFTRAMANDAELRNEALAWFLGGTLTATLLQSVAWAHGQLGVMPSALQYGPLVIGAGWLVLLVERRANARRVGDSSQPLPLRGESFIGFAAIGLGLLLSLVDPHWRILALAAAAAAWFDQARGRDQALHWWLGCVLIACTGFAVVAHPWMPAPARAPALIGVGAVITLASAWPGRESHLAAALRGTGIASLVVGVGVTAVLHWHGHCPDWLAAASILAAALVTAVQACQVDRTRWALVAACMAGVALPYLGCVDLASRSLHGNHLVAGFTGLAIIWALAGKLPKADTIARTRSLVGLVLGLLAVIALLVRVSWERGLPGEADAWHMTIDYSGSLGMAGVLILISWWSRSLIPGLLATVVLVILFPELKAQFNDQFEALGWGSGLGGAATGLGLVLACFPLRRAGWLKHLGEGDSLWPGQPFPWRRFDHALITWPLLVAAIFLTLRVDTWTIATVAWRQEGAIPWRSQLAVLLTVSSWIALALYRDPHPLGGPAWQHGWRRATAVATCWAVLVTTACFLHAELPQRWPSVLAWGLAALTLIAALLRFVPDWSMRDLGSRLGQATIRLAVLGGALGLVGLGAGLPLPDLSLLFTVCVAAALIDASASASRWRGLWAWSLVWTFIAACCVRLGRSPLVHDEDWWLAGDQWAALPWCAALLGAALIQSLRELAQRRGRALRVDAGIGVPLAMSTSWLLLLSLLIMAMRLVDYPPQAPDRWCWSLLLGGLLLQTIWQRNWFMALASAIAGWFLLLHGDLHAAERASQRGALLIMPESIALLATFLALIPAVAEALVRRCPRACPVVVRLSPVGHRDLLNWIGLTLPAVGLLSLLGAEHWRDEPGDLVGCYALILAPAIVALRGRNWIGTVWAIGMAVIAFICANIQTVTILWGAMLTDWGLHTRHLIALGMGASALLLSGLGRLLPILQATVRLANLVLAIAVLLLITVNYIAAPDLSDIRPARLLASGILALIAGRALRHIAHGQLVGNQTVWQGIASAGYHLAISLAITCAALLIPALRQPTFALVAIGLPCVYLYLRAELDRHPSYRLSAAALTSAIILLTLFRPAFAMLLFTHSGADVVRAEHYHANGPMIAILGFILVRLTGLGADRMFAFLGGAAVILGSFFMLTALPGLSPFSHPGPAAWMAIGLAHAWTLITDQRSPLRTGLLRLLGYDGESWLALRREWGLLLQAGTQLMVLIGTMAGSGLWAEQANLLCFGGASLLLHHGLIRGSPWYLRLATAEILVGLHVGALLPTAWSPRHAAWGLLGLWGLLLLVEAQVRRHLRWRWLSDSGALIGPLPGCVLIGLLLVHVIGWDPASPQALAWTTLGLLAAGLTPGRQSWTAACLPLGLLHLAAWSCVAAGWPIRDGVPIAALLVTSTVLLGLMETLAHRQPGWSSDSWWGRTALARWWAHLPAWFPAYQVPVLLGGLIGAAGLVGWCSVVSPQAPDLALAVPLLVLCGMQTWFWYRLAQTRQNLWCLFAAEAALGIGLMLIRQELRHHLPFWQSEFDIWAILALTALLNGSKQLWDRHPRHIRLPLLWSAAAMPLLTISWIVLHGLDSNLALVAIGLHSVGFTYLGRRDQESPFHVLAIMGFTALVVLVLWTRLDLRVLHAYTIPVGIGLLIILQLLSARVPLQLRNATRGVILAVMLGSSAFHALLDERYPILFHFILLFVGLGTLVTGSILRLKIYAVLGLIGCLVAVGSLTVLGLQEVDRGVRMSLIGGLVLLIGAGLVGGTIYLKARREAVLERLDRWRARWASWE